ncbi:unnamed protein product [Protopolystoma xenopodis]|uniref:Uncharacterized protein n=1 Tax=Protopolystoma xenopodis TaxID=117903 RepID=A0A3S5CM59_9PLAT|nr:unnamed protein product [Protopolystoma xenopodis]
MAMASGATCQAEGQPNSFDPSKSITAGSHESSQSPQIGQVISSPAQHSYNINNKHAYAHKLDNNVDQEQHLREHHDFQMHQLHDQHEESLTVPSSGDHIRQVCSPDPSNYFEQANSGPPFDSLTSGPLRSIPQNISTAFSPGCPIEIPYDLPPSSHFALPTSRLLTPPVPGIEPGLCSRSMDNVAPASSLGSVSACNESLIAPGKGLTVSTSTTVSGLTAVITSSLKEKLLNVPGASATVTGNDDTGASGLAGPISGLIGGPSLGPLGYGQYNPTASLASTNSLTRRATPTLFAEPPRVRDYSEYGIPNVHQLLMQQQQQQQQNQQQQKQPMQTKQMPQPSPQLLSYLNQQQQL